MRYLHISCLVLLLSDQLIREVTSTLLLVYHLVLELRRERLVSDENLLAVLDQIAQLLLEVRTCLLLEPGHLHVQRLLTRADRRLLELAAKRQY